MENTVAIITKRSLKEPQYIKLYVNGRYTGRIWSYGGATVKRFNDRYMVNLDCEAFLWVDKIARIT